MHASHTQAALPEDIKHIKLLTISSLYPNNNDPKHGIFVENRLRNLLRDYPTISAQVIAPVPWFPISSPRFAEYQKFVGVLAAERRHNIEITHPRYLVIPKIGMLLTPLLMAWSLFWSVRKHIKQHGRPDIIDAHYFYPDGVAVALVAKLYGIPFTCTSRGTDLNLIADMPLPRAMIKWVIARASKTMAVCQALSERLLELGAKSPETLRNGVDLDFFRPVDDEFRKRMAKAIPMQAGSTANIDTILLSVGWLVERKGHYVVIDALQQLPTCMLLIAGNGPDEEKLKAQVSALGLSQRVQFLGALSQENLRTYYQLADALVLASSREGWANVLLESMACGTPVVATNIWGTPEVVQNTTAGQLCERSARGIAQGVKALLTDYPERSAVRQYAQKFDWQATSTGQYRIFSAIFERRKAPRAQGNLKL